MWKQNNKNDNCCKCKPKFHLDILLSVCYINQLKLSIKIYNFTGS